MSLLTRPLAFLPCLAFTRSHTGYIPFEGRPGMINTEELRFENQSKLLNLQPISKITFKLDPFHPRVHSIRDTMVHLSFRRVRATNQKCIFKTEILSGQEEPEMKLEMNSGQNIVFKTGTMSGSDLLHQMNKIVLPMVVEAKEDVLTKAAKVSAAAAGGGKKQPAGKKGRK